jgi:hypothetical protein
MSENDLTPVEQKVLALIRRSSYRLTFFNIKDGSRLSWSQVENALRHLLECEYIVKHVGMHPSVVHYSAVEVEHEPKVVGDREPSERIQRGSFA